MFNMELHQIHWSACADGARMCGLAMGSLMAANVITVVFRALVTPLYFAFRAANSNLKCRDFEGCEKDLTGCAEV